MKKEQDENIKEVIMDVNNKLAQHDFMARIYPEPELASLGIIFPDIFSFEELVIKDAEQHNISIENKSLQQICQKVYPPDINAMIEKIFGKPKSKE